MKKYLYTVGMTLWVYAENDRKAESIVESLRDIDYNKLRVADWEFVEKYDLEMGATVNFEEEA